MPWPIARCSSGCPARRSSSSGLKAAVKYAKDNGGRWNEVEITVHLPREDIVYATDKVHRLIDALRPPRRPKA
jgi:hypothetical protein